MSSKRKSEGTTKDRKQMTEENISEIEALHFEDVYEDEVEEEEYVVEEEGEEDDMEMEEKKTMNHLYQPNVDGEAEEMEYDNSAYMLLHRLRVEWPCLSFDFIKDALGAHRTKLPATAYMIAGTQASEPGKDKLIVMKMSEMHRTRKDRDENESSDSDEDSDEDDDLDDDAVADQKSIKHPGAVNRVRSMPQSPQIVASWSDTGNVFIWDINAHLRTLGALPGGSLSATPINTPIFTFQGHKDEGFAMDFSPVKPGAFISGDCAKGIYLWQIENSGKCSVDSTPFSGHSKSVEDIQWSPTEATVFASCSVDLSVKIWDVRERKKSMVSIDKSHEEDVNVISWNKKVPFLLASGSDDGSFKVWDLRMVKKGVTPDPVGFFKWHTAPITSLEWHPHDETVIAATGADNQVSIWDFGLEDDPEQAMLAPKLDSTVTGSDGKTVEIPPQLLFVHQGQIDPKELHFHPQIPGLIGSTAADGFHAFICEPLDPKGISNKYIV